MPTLALLAGGAGTRMGGPKSHLRLRGQPILRYLHARLAWPGPALLITAPGFEHPPAHDLFTREIPDPVAGQGPLRGLHTALAAATTDIVVVTTVDMPNVARPHLDFLASELASRPAAAGLLLQTTPGDPRTIEPFPCALRPCLLLPELDRRLAAGQLSVRALANHPGITLLAAPADWSPDTWANLNHPKDLAAFDADAVRE